MKKTIRKNERGITLIALVITIIVLIILAGISITMISGQDGILTRTGNASVQEDVSGTKEKIKLELMGKYDTTGKYTNADVITAVKNATGNDVAEKAQTVLTKKGNEVDISDLWVTASTPGGGTGAGETITQIEKGKKYNSKSEYTETDTGYKITIPAGYTVKNDSGSTISEGIVIEDDNNNEFVWVPVPNAIANSEPEIATMIQQGKYPMAVPTGATDSNGNTAYRGVLYDFSSSSGTVSMTAKSATSDWREPAYLTDPNYGDESANGKSYLRNIVGMTQIDDTELKTAWTNQMQNEFDNMVEKVSSAGGYYISRYEMSGTIDSSGNISTESKPNATAFTGGTSYKEDYLTWYGLYKAGKGYRHNGITSTMIWGSQYDQMLIWMAKTGTDVTQANSSKMNTSSTTTGVTGSQDIINKIYDIYGAHFDWTLEAYSTYNRASRGGYYDYDFSPAYRNLSSPTSRYSSYSSRLALYIE